MAEFDYRKFLAENKLTKVSKGTENGKAQIISEGFESDLRMKYVSKSQYLTENDGGEVDEANKQKEDYLDRQKRAKEGNWKGSLGAFVETHGEEIGNLKTFKDIDEYISKTMAPELSDEAYKYVQNLRSSSRSPYRFIVALYNATLKGSGLGLTENEELTEGTEKGSKIVPDDSHVNRKRASKVKPGMAGQDRMARSEMKGEKITVTMPDGTKKDMTKREFNAYRKKRAEEKAKKTLKEGLEADSYCPWAEAEEVGVLEKMNLQGEDSIKDEVKQIFYGGAWPVGDTDEDVTVEVLKGDPNGQFDCFTSDDFMELPGLENVPDGPALENMADLEVDIYGSDWGLTIYGKQTE